MAFRGRGTVVVPIGAPTSTVDIGDPFLTGGSGVAADAQHQHAVPAPGAGYVAVLAAVGVDGAAGTAARSDHRHPHPPADHAPGGPLDLSGLFVNLGGAQNITGSKTLPFDNTIAGGQILYGAGIKTGLAAGNSTAPIKLEASQSAFKNDATHDFNVGLIVFNWTANGAGLVVGNHALGDGIFAQTDDTTAVLDSPGQTAFAINVFAGTPTVQNTAGTGINVQRWGTGRAISAIAEAGSGAAELVKLALAANAPAALVQHAAAVAYTTTALSFDMGAGAGAFTGRFLDLKNGGASRFSVDSTGLALTAGGYRSANNTPTSALKSDGATVVNLLYIDNTNVVKAGAVDGGAAMDLALYAGAAERARITSAGSVVLAKAALATTATDGYTYLPSVAGAPTGAPTAQTGAVPIVLDTTNSKLWARIGGAWKGVVLA